MTEEILSIDMRVEKLENKMKGLMQEQENQQKQQQSADLSLLKIEQLARTLDAKVTNSFVSLQNECNGLEINFKTIQSSIAKLQSDHVELNQSIAARINPLIEDFSKLDVQLSQFQELIELKARSGSILRGVIVETKMAVNDAFITPLRQEMSAQQNLISQRYATIYDHNELLTNLQEIARNLDEKQLFTLREIRQLDTKVSKDLENYVFTTDFECKIENTKKELESQICKCALEEELKILREQCTFYIKSEDFVELQAIVEVFQKHVQQNFSQKKEVVNLDLSLRNWSNQTFPSIKDVEMKLQNYKETLDKMTQSALITKTQSENLLKELKLLKDDIDERQRVSLTKMQDQVNSILKRFEKMAMYSDFKELYNKVLPSLSIFQEQLAVISAEHEQNKEIIKNFDKNLSLCAKKHEIIEYSKELRHYCKENMLKEFKNEIEIRFEDFNQKFIDFSDKLNAREEKQLQQVQNQIRSKMVKFQQYLNKINQDAGLSPAAFEQLKNMAIHLAEMLKQKAETVDIIELRETKTNKQDTEQCVRNIESILKMLESVSVLLTETLRYNYDSLNNKKQEHSYLYLFNQAKIVATWIQNFQTLHSSSQIYKLPQDMYALKEIKQFDQPENIIERLSTPPSLNKVDAKFKTFNRARLTRNSEWSTQTRAKNLSSVGQKASLQGNSMETQRYASQVLTITDSKESRKNESQARWHATPIVSQSLNITDTDWKQKLQKQLKIERQQLPILRSNQTEAINKQFNEIKQYSELINMSIPEMLDSGQPSGTELQSQLLSTETMLRQTIQF